MKKPEKNIKVIISGGGTGGHIFPALSIAGELMIRNPGNEILFVGARGRMEMEKVPKAGYKIIGLPIAGIQRKLTIKNIAVPFYLLYSLFMAYKIIKKFRPDVVVGVGGYASGPVMLMATYLKIPTLIQEQNSYAGMTNKLLSKKVSGICVAYKEMDKYFPKEKIALTGNPVRNIEISSGFRKEAHEFFTIPDNARVVLIVGGSLGARTINESILNGLDVLGSLNVFFIWQTGSYYFENLKSKFNVSNYKNIRIYDFIYRMDLAYNIADLVISRAGAISIAEICHTAKAAILIPSPNVAEDHQTKNARALVKENAAVMIRDEDAMSQLIPKIKELIDDEALRTKLSANSKKLSYPDSTVHIVDEIYKILMQ